MSKKEEVIWFDTQINGFIGAKKEVVEGKEVWVKIAPTKKAKGYINNKMRCKGK